MTSPSPTPDHEYLARQLQRLTLEALTAIRARGDSLRAMGLEGPLSELDDVAPDSLAGSLAQARQRVEEWHERHRAGEPIAALRLFDACGLDQMERDIVLWTVAPHLDTTFRDLLTAVGRLSPLDDPLSVDVLLKLTAPDLEERLAAFTLFDPGAPLLSHALVRLRMDEVFLQSSVAPGPGVLATIMGEDRLFGEGEEHLELVEPRVGLDQLVLPPEVVGVIESLGAHHGAVPRLDKGAGAGADATRGMVVLVTGASGSGKTLVAEALAKTMAKPLVSVDPIGLFEGPKGVQEGVGLVFREAAFRDAVILIDDCELVLYHRNHGNTILATLYRALDRHDGVVVMTTAYPEALDDALERRILYRLELDPPGPREREALWEEHLRGQDLDEGVDLGFVARKFEYNGGFIANAARAAAIAARTRGGDSISEDDVLHGARTQIRHKLTKYAEKTVTRLRLEDLVLPPEVRSQIQEIIDAVRAKTVVFEEWGFGSKLSTGRGLVALFDGESGTGKTLCGEIIAAELGLALYRVNVASILDKYVGETEKNLTKIFDEAGAAHTLLLFDEADALFAKRVNVEHASDRYANAEINVLLQLIERYEGAVILTTNLKKGIDKAFERRLNYKIDFPFPDRHYRTLIWRRLVPDATPLGDDVDFELLSKSFELSGGSIRNSILRAAYLAASRGDAITMDDFQEAAVRECRATGKLYRMPQPDEEF